MADDELLTYGKYLQLGKILSATIPQSVLRTKPVHDENLFIVLHQTKELWFFQMLLELRAAREEIKRDGIDFACDYIERCTRIFDVLTITWEVLATLRPREFWKFRGFFGSASGLQSAQFREIEYLLGIRQGSAESLEYQEDNSKPREALEQELDRPSLWDEVIRALGRSALPLGKSVPQDLLDRPWGQPYPYPRPKPEPEGASDQGKADGNAPPKEIKGDPVVEALWLSIYNKSDANRDWYRLGERLLDLAAHLAVWRAKHVATVERFIGGLRGSGGKGVPYLLDTMKKRPFPELWSVRDHFEDWNEIKK